MKVPLGKHCGFVQFVRKPDAERAIEKMQGFPIGGSRIRLSWGRSQCESQCAIVLRELTFFVDKAAQAAAQAAQAAAFQAQYQAQYQTQLSQAQAHPQASNQTPSTLTKEQAIQLLEKFGLTNLLASSSVAGGGAENVSNERQIAAALLNDVDGDHLASYNAFIPPVFGPRQSIATLPATGFSPFSPDPNYLGELKNADGSSSQGQSSLSHTAKTYTPWYPGQDEKVTNTSGKVSPTSAQTMRPTSASQRFAPFFGDSPSSYQSTRASSRQEAPIARPDLSGKSTQNLPQQEEEQEQEQDGISDLNGTLASLDLDQHGQGGWKGDEREQSHSTAAH